MRKNSGKPGRCENGKVICGAIFQNGKLLMEKRKGTWYLSSCKQREGEVEIGCLFRMIKERHLDLRLKNTNPIGKVEVDTPNKTEEAEIFSVKACGHISPSSVDGSEFAWLSQAKIQRSNLAGLSTFKIITDLLPNQWL